MNVKLKRRTSMMKQQRCRFYSLRRHCHDAVLRLSNATGLTSHTLCWWWCYGSFQVDRLRCTQDKDAHRFKGVFCSGSQNMEVCHSRNVIFTATFKRHLKTHLFTNVYLISMYCSYTALYDAGGRLFVIGALSPVYTTRVDGQSSRVTGFHYPSTRAVLTGARFPLAVLTGRQLGQWKPGFGSVFSI